MCFPANPHFFLSRIRLLLLLVFLFTLPGAISFLAQAQENSEIFPFQSSRDFTAAFFCPHVIGIHIYNPKGGIQVVGEKRQDILVEVNVTVQGEELSLLERYLEAIQLTWVVGDETLEIQLQEGWKPDCLKNQQVHFLLRVPPDLLLDLSNGSGMILLQGMNQGAFVHSSERGQVLLEGITGDLLLDLHTCSFIIQDIDGSIRGEIQHSQGTLQEITGPLFLESKHNSLTICQINGPVNINSHHDTLEICHLQGESQLTSSHSQLFLSNLEGAVEAHLNHGMLELKQIASPVDITSSFGTVNLLLLSEVDGYQFHLSTHFGMIESSIPLLQERDGYVWEMTGLYGKGIHPITVKIEHGDLFLEVR